jgi:hypothetical protein
MADRISFMSFLGFFDPFPDSRTIWLLENAWLMLEKMKLSGQNFRGNWMLWVYRLNMERPKMPRSLKQTPESSRNHMEKDAMTCRSRDGSSLFRVDKRCFPLRSEGKGAALKTRFESLNGDAVIVTIDKDGQQNTSLVLNQRLTNFTTGAQSPQSSEALCL